LYQIKKDSTNVVKRDILIMGFRGLIKDQRVQKLETLTCEFDNKKYYDMANDAISKGKTIIVRGIKQKEKLVSCEIESIN
jgi:hypothetical protein